MVVTFRLENTGDEPTYARDPTPLVVDGKRYSADPAKQSYLPRGPIPSRSSRARSRP